MRMKRILALVWKELLAVLRDKRTRISILLPPVIQLFIFTYASTLDVKNVSIGIINRDNGEQGFELVQRFYGSPVFSHVTFLEGMQQITPYMDLQKGVLVVSIDEQFSRSLDARHPAEVQLILDGRKSNTAQIVAGYANNILSQFNRDFCAKSGIPQQQALIVPRTWFNPNVLYFWYNIPCLVGIISMLTCLIVTTQSVARERELGTFDQLLVSPLVPSEIVVGKIIPGILIGMLEGLLLLAVGVWVLGVPFTGSFGIFLISLFLFVSSISGIGLFISSLSATQQQAMLGTSIFMMPSVLLAGYATPIENMPAWLQPFTYVLPLKYMLVISKGIFLKAMPAHLIWTQVWPLILIAVCNIVGAGLFFRRRIV